MLQYTNNCKDIFQIFHFLYHDSQKDKQLRNLNLVFYLKIMTAESLPLPIANLPPAISFETLETHAYCKRKEAQGESSLINNIYKMEMTGNKSVPVAGHLLYPDIFPF